MECKHNMPPNLYIYLNISHRDYEPMQMLIPCGGTNFLHVYLRHKP